MKRQVAIVLIGVLLVAGFSTDPTTRSTQEGAGAGAMAGGLLCAFARCTPEQMAAAVAVGADAGALVGYSLANNIEKRRKVLAGRENDLDARLTFVRGLNSDLEKFNSTLTNQVREAESAVEQKRLSRTQLAKTRKDLDVQIESANSQLDGANRELDDLKRFRASRPRPSSALDAEIAKYERLLAEARNDTQALASARQRI